MSIQDGHPGPDISVQICTHNRKDVLRAVLESLVDQSLAPERYELVLVDDGCTDGTAEMVAAMGLPYHVEYLRQEHSGLATARNTGIRGAHGRIILYIDDDVLADRNLLEEHVRTHDQHEMCVVNGWVNHVEEPRRPEKPTFRLADISTSFFWTSNVSVKRQHLVQAGMFDEDFKEYGWEDQEVGLRLMALGLKARNNYRAIGFHVKRPPRRRDLERMLAQAEAKGRTAALYIRKHPRMRTRLATGIHPPRLAFYRLTRLGNWLERLCRTRLERPDLAPEDELRGLDAWCARQLSTLHYFSAIRNGRSDG
jgi:glycosyltransferase involved in cell wall biosynthesis